MLSNVEKDMALKVTFLRSCVICLLLPYSYLHCQIDRTSLSPLCLLAQHCRIKRFCKKKEFVLLKILTRSLFSMHHANYELDQIKIVLRQGHSKLGDALELTLLRSVEKWETSVTAKSFKKVLMSFKNCHYFSVQNCAGRANRTDRNKDQTFKS